MKIGLIGYSGVPTGLGELNRQIDKYVDLHSWLLVPHSRYGVQARPDCKHMVCRSGGKAVTFTEDLKSIVFCETPFFPQVVTAARYRRQKTTCVAMQEWFPQGAKGWASEVTTVICPTQDAYDQLSHYRPCKLFPWPVDTDRFQFKQRTQANRFLYLHGGGGVGDRKGAKYVREMIRKWPEIPLTIASQATTNFPEGPNIKFVGPAPDSQDLYDQGDVLIHPHCCDGLGLQVMEAMACGLPVVSTDGRPWNEFPAIARIPATEGRMKIKRRVAWFTPDVEEMTKILRRLKESDITSESQSAREWAESRSWKAERDKFLEIINA